MVPFYYPIFLKVISFVINSFFFFICTTSDKRIYEIGFSWHKTYKIKNRPIVSIVCDNWKQEQILKTQTNEDKIILRPTKLREVRVSSFMKEKRKRKWIRAKRRAWKGEMAWDGVRWRETQYLNSESIQNFKGLF